jgi:two-component system phosphate regulon response regulator PhoB
LQLRALVRAKEPRQGLASWAALGPCKSSTPSAIGTDAMQDTVLVVEDEADMVDLLRYNLSKAGLCVLIAGDGITALEIARKYRPDVVILDLLLPHMDGYAVCKTLKNNSETSALPLVILTARGEPNDRIKGLEIGADDYLTKPFNLRELILRVRALLRRSRSSARDEVLEVNAITEQNLSRLSASATLYQAGKQPKLDLRQIESAPFESNFEFALINLKSVLGYENPMVTRTVDTHIRRLREKLGKHAERLETVRCQGYRFNAVLFAYTDTVEPGRRSALYGG